MGHYERLRFYVKLRLRTWFSVDWLLLIMDAHKLQTTRKGDLDEKDRANHSHGIDGYLSKYRIHY
jgi:hypothetical protein